MSTGFWVTVIACCYFAIGVLVQLKSLEEIRGLLIKAERDSDSLTNADKAALTAYNRLRDSFSTPYLLFGLLFEVVFWLPIKVYVSLTKSK